MQQIKREIITAAILITAILLLLSACDQPADSAGETYDLFYGLDQVDDASPTVTIQQGQAVGRDAWFEFEVANIDSEIMPPGVYDGWCIEWTKPIAQQGDTHEDLKMYSTFGEERWKPLNYFLNIKDSLKAEDPSLHFREFQAIIWTITKGPEFDLHTLSEDELPQRLKEDGEPHFDKDKVLDIAASIKADASSFVYGPNSTYAVFLKTGDDEQDVMIPADPPEETISHGYIEGVTPSDYPAYEKRTYPIIQAAWDGPGGDKRWLGWNLGATDAPASFDDKRMNRTGWFFQFNGLNGAHWVWDGTEPFGGRPVGHGTYNSHNTTNWLSETDPCNAALGSDWRIPTIEEWKAFYTAPVRGGMGGGTAIDAFNSDLNLHLTGYMSWHANPGAYHTYTGYYISSTLAEYSVAYYISFDEDVAVKTLEFSANLSTPIRCIED